MVAQGMVPSWSSLPLSPFLVTLTGLLWKPITVQVIEPRSRGHTEKPKGLGVGGTLRSAEVAEHLLQVPELGVQERC
jgi:hypothetical protein